MTFHVARRTLRGAGVILAIGVMLIALVAWAVSLRTPAPSVLDQVRIAGLPWEVHATSVGPSPFGRMQDVALSLQDDARLPDGQLMDLAIALCEAFVPAATGAAPEVFRVVILLPRDGHWLQQRAWVDGPKFLMAVRGDTCSHDLG